MRTPSPTGLARQYMGKVYALALSIVRNEDDAEDITQNTFVKILKNLPRFRGGSRVSTWIYRIAYNEALMYLRKSKRRLEVSGPAGEIMRDTPYALRRNAPKLPDEELISGELRNRIDRAIAEMPIHYRMPLLLRHVNDIPLNEAARVLGVKVNSLKTRLHRAHLLLKKDIEEYRRDRIAGEEREDSRCGIWTRFIFDFAMGRLQEGKRKAFQGHIADCPDCTLFLDRYLQAISITESLRCKDMPPDLRAKIESFLEGTPRRSPSPGPR